MNSAKLTEAVVTILQASMDLSPDRLADELAGIVDDLSDGEKYFEAIVDGIRWGAQAAVNVERDRGAMLRVCLPDGIRITHEWDNEADADQAIKDALAAIEGARVTAQKVGDE